MHLAGHRWYGGFWYIFSLCAMRHRHTSTSIPRLRACVCVSAECEKQNPYNRTMRIELANKWQCAGRKKHRFEHTKTNASNILKFEQFFFSLSVFIHRSRLICFCLFIYFVRTIEQTHSIVLPNNYVCLSFLYLYTIVRFGWNSICNWWISATISARR